MVPVSSNAPPPVKVHSVKRIGSGEHVMIAQSRPEYATSARDVFRLLFRHKTKVIFCFAVTMSVAIAIICCWPRKYRSESKLLVRLGRETVMLDPTATTRQIMPVSVSRETEVNSVLEMLRSRIMIEKLVDELGPDAILRPTSAAITSNAKLPDVQNRSGSTSWHNLDPVSEREKAIDRVGQCLDAAIEKKSDVITVSGKANSPDMAQRLVAKLVDIYLGEHSRLHRTAGSQAFFTEQTELLRKNLDNALSKLRDAKNSMGIVGVENQRTILQQEIVDVESKLAQSTAELAAVRERANALRTGFKGLPERLQSDETQGFPNVAADSMRQDLYLLEIREAELASRFTDAFPALVAVREQIRAAVGPLKKEEQRRTQTTTTVNSVHNQLQLNLLTENANVESLGAQTLALNEQLSQLRKRVRLLNEHEPQIAKLEQELALYKANYTTYCEKSEESRIDRALQNERITNVNVVQPASLVASPVSPRKGTVLVLGIVSGLVLGVAAALLADRLDPSLKTATEVENQLSLPVLVAIPRVSQRHTVLR
jgi:polysaccharide biosynthesis protein PslE